MRNLLLLFLVILSFYSCTHNTTANQQLAQKQDSVRYVNLIMNLVMNDYNYLIPDYGKEAELVRTDNSYYLYKATRVTNTTLKKDTINGFTGNKEIKDRTLGLTLMVCRWTCGCEVSLPNTIIYISDKKDFHYAFLLTDEELPPNDDTLARPQGPPSLEFQLNFLTNCLQINSLGQAKEAYHFFSLITDSLLGLKKITLSDTVGIRADRAAYTAPYSNIKGCDSCVEAIDNYINKMAEEIKSGNGDIFYYHSSSKYYKGFWRFEFTSKSGRTYIKAHFTKCMCRIPATS